MVKGKGDAEYKLNAFDKALLNAGVGNTNLVRLSSILPPHSQEVDPVMLEPGQLLTLAYSSYTSNVKGELIAAAVSVAIPQDPNLNGLIMEHAGPGTSEEMQRIVIRKAELGMEYRGFKVKEIKSISSEHETVDIGAVFAAVVLV
ncbi:MAG: arginine decarboxylase, pyruvoyl-dependent [Spirochaetes bacterium]|nr:arginine decarboxylase, pyruvoyl-dependent [Spirochaetota bacterium]